MVQSTFWVNFSWTKPRNHEADCFVNLSLIIVRSNSDPRNFVPSTQQLMGRNVGSEGERERESANHLYHHHSTAPQFTSSSFLSSCDRFRMEWKGRKERREGGRAERTFSLLGRSVEVRDQPKGFRPKPKEGVLISTISAESRKEPKGNRKIRKKPKEGISVLSAKIGLKMLPK